MDLWNFVENSSVKNVSNECLIKCLSRKVMLFWWVMLGTPRKNWPVALLYWPWFSILSIPQVEACYGGTLIWRLFLCLWKCIPTFLLYIRGTYAYNFIYIIDYWLSLSLSLSLYIYIYTSWANKWVEPYTNLFMSVNRAKPSFIRI
jgi:hypothetical protein